MREPKLMVAVGKKGVGKSYSTFDMLKGYVSGNPSKGVKGRKVLIFDVNDEYEDVRPIALKDVPLFSVHPKIEMRRVRPLKTNGSRMTLNEIAETLFWILGKFQGGCLLIEDINKYVSDNLPDDLVGAICTNRHVDLDIIMHFQSIGRITTKLWQNLNWIRFHKNMDSVDRHQNKFPDKIEFLRIIENMVNIEYQKGNIRFCCWCENDELKVSGKVPSKSFQEAIEQYINQNQRRVLSPLLKERDSNGKLKYKPEEAYNYLKNKLLKTYS
jgi:hypothetical protein